MKVPIFYNMYILLAKYEEWARQNNKESTEGVYVYNYIMLPCQVKLVATKTYGKYSSNLENDIIMMEFDQFLY